MISSAASTWSPDGYAHGGLGWIYLAQDKNVEDTWVVLKGLLDSGDASAMATAAAEKRFLAEVNHANIVGIKNFVQYDGAGYIVMSYVGGESLHDLRVRHREETGAAAGGSSIAYILGILPALGYLHRHGLVFCDSSQADNVIQTEEQLTLIDLGGVQLEPIAAPRGSLRGQSDTRRRKSRTRGQHRIRSVHRRPDAGRALHRIPPATRHQNRYATRLPPAEDVPAFQRYESFHRFLEKATAADPRARGSHDAADMSEQLYGVLRSRWPPTGEGRHRSPAPSSPPSSGLLPTASVALPSGSCGRPD